MHVLTIIEAKNKMRHMKIIIRVPNWIGDSILSVPAIKSLSKNFPGAQIWIAANEWVRELFQSFDFIEGFVLLPPSNKLKDLKSSVKKIKEHKFDAGLLMTNSFASALLFSLAKIPERWGYSRDGRSILLTNGVSSQTQSLFIHQVDYYRDLIKKLGFKVYPSELFLPLKAEDKKESEKILDSLNVDRKQPLITLNPGAYYGSAKRWPAKKFAETATLLQQRKNATIIITGSKNESWLAETIISYVPEKPISLIGKTSLRQLAGIISDSSLFITNDSGPMHMANALKTPVISIFGPTDPRVTGPFQKPSKIIKKNVACWPCSYRECPYDHRCMERIEAEEVYQASKEFIE